MSDTNLDRRVAEIVGWEWVPPEANDEWTSGTGFDGKHTRLPQHRVEDAIAALEAMREKHEADWQIHCYDGEPYHVSIHLGSTGYPDEKHCYGEDAELPLAICKAIVATVEEK